VRSSRHRAGATGWFPAALRIDSACLDVDGELDFVADEHAAALKGLVPVEAEVLAVERALRLEAGDLDARRVDAGALELRPEQHRAGDALDRELSVDREVPAVAPDGDAAEGRGRKSLDIEESGAAQVGVASADAGVDAGGLDGHLDAGSLEVIGIEPDGPGEVVEAAVDGGEHHVLDGEADGAVVGID